MSYVSHMLNLDSSVRKEKREGVGMVLGINQVTRSEGSVWVSQWDDTREEGRDREVYNRLPGED